ncbi:hypothetical protein JCM11641_005370 [Rhodosporidiobolus odoratus]
MTTYHAAFSPSAPAFHPKLKVTVQGPDAATPDPSCDLYALVSVPPGLIVDKYELHRLHRWGRLGANDAASDGRASLQVLGEGDLEAPVWKVEANEGGGAAAILLRLKDGKGKAREVDSMETVEIPLHGRYQMPVPERWSIDGERLDKVQVELDWPRVFWACNAATSPALEELPACGPPSLPAHLSFATLSSRTLYYLSLNSSTSLSGPTTCPPGLLPPLTLLLPTGVAADLPLVESVTLIAVWGCFLWLVWMIFGLWRRGRREEAKSRAVEEKKKE